SGRNNHGVHRGQVKLGEDGVFAGGTAASFDGATSYVEITSGTWGGGRELTVEAWVKVRQGCADFQAVVSAVGSELFHLQLHSAGNIVICTDTGYVQLPAVSQEPCNIWRHLALVVAPQDVKLYVDGVVVSASQACFASIEASTTVRIGGGFGGGRL